ncbi:MAG: galactose mutarotase [Prolixibacteraceae bacterium]|jgi:aldose 1-epimerase|nr:galactose mutarotase [Prolixibacteraceae bacterium]
MIKNAILLIVIATFVYSCSEQKQPVFTDAVADIDAAAFDQTIEGKATALYTMVNENGMGVKVTNFGARVVAICVPDANGNPVDVALGHDNLDDYTAEGPETFYGAAIGRYGNRIGNAQFELDGKVYELPANNGPNHLHGGPKGYFDVVWDAEQVSDSKIIFTYLSPDGEMGYPGNLEISMAYELTDDNAVSIEYTATTDKATVCNLTHHSYFNLSGAGAATINDHVLMIDADSITPVDETLIPTGELASVAGTPFDFTSPMEIGKRVNSDHQQMTFGGGYDHNWVLNKDDNSVTLAARLYSPVTNIQMDVLTDKPGLQFYGGNFLDGSTTGKRGLAYEYRSALCLETQHFPDSPNKPQFPSTTLMPGETYKHVCIYKFSVR